MNEIDRKEKSPPLRAETGRSCLSVSAFGNITLNSPFRSIFLVVPLKALKVTTLQSFRGHLVNAVFGEGGTRLEDQHRGGRQNWDGERTSEAASREPLHLEEGVPVNHGEVSWGGNKRSFCARFFQVEDEPLGWLLPLSCSQSAKNKRSNQLNFNTAVFLFFFRLSPSTWNHPSPSDSFLCSTQCIAVFLTFT